MSDIATIRPTSAEETAHMKRFVEHYAAAKATLDSFKVDLYTANSSPMDTIEALRSTYVPPCEVVMFPLGHQIAVKPTGCRKPLTFTVDESWAKLFAHQFDRMKSAGSKPYFDYGHKQDSGASGYVKNVYWAHQRGVAALVDWSPEAAEMILNGTCNAFSPTWHHFEKSFPRGIGICMGALLSASMKPALQRMPAIKPTRQREVVELLAKRFWQFINERLPHFQKSDHGIIECFAAVAQDVPDMYRAHLLLKAIRKESDLDVEVAYS